MNAMTDLGLHNDADPLTVTDGMPTPLRRLVHEYGYSVVRAFLDIGVSEPGHIRHIIAMVRNAGGEAHVGMAASQRQKGGPVLASLDPWLIAQGAGFTARQVVQVIRDRGYTVLPKGPTQIMIAASLSALDGMGPVQRQRKHLLRLQSALVAGDRTMWEPAT